MKFTGAVTLVLAAVTLVGAGSLRSIPQAGAEIAPAVSFVGDHSHIKTREFFRVRTRDAWEELWYKHTGESTKHENAKRGFAPRVDFAKYEVVAFFVGATKNEEGEDAQSVAQIDGATRIRVQPMTFQSMAIKGQDSGVDCEPFGIWIIERSDKQIVIESNVQGLIGGAPVWKEIRRLEAPAK